MLEVGEKCEMLARIRSSAISWETGFPPMFLSWRGAQTKIGALQMKIAAHVANPRDGL